ncbi:homeodomain-interacting protein kinase 1 [Lates calcarifer]|uniref:Homeodomain-interacting protein kinase 1 n=1 Tax=Lates calcarifer TaxID=8187 RepID=A0AAJ7PR35_LATCA|nr:homeodomain-interacting protein kinase 1 [Lates calcarifer]
MIVSGHLVSSPSSPSYRPELVDILKMKEWNIWKTNFGGKKPSSALPSSKASSCLEDDETKPGSYEVLKSDILCSSTNRYLIQDFIGEGSFGKIAKAVNLSTSQDVALKILKTEDTADREIKMLDVVRILDPVKKSMVQFFERFDHKGQTCLVFEKLDRSLFDFFVEREGRPLSLNEIRPVVHQLLTAFDALKGIGVVHSDLKPDNVMLVNHSSTPFRVKLIDFGVSFKTTEKMQGMTIQPVGYRAPEVILGLPITEAIDMWGLGCLLGFLYHGQDLFADCEYQSMKGIVEMLGQPADHLLNDGHYTQIFFKENDYWDEPRWWMKTPLEYQLETGIEPEKWQSPLRCLDDLIIHRPEMEKAELEDRRAFVSLLKCLLRSDPNNRITPGKALKHPFVEMDHLWKELDTGSYADDSAEKMMIVPDYNLDSREMEELQKPSVKLPSNDDSGSDSPQSCSSLLSIKIVFDTPDGAEPAAAMDAIGSAVSQGAACPAETSTNDVSPDEVPPARVKMSRMKRIRKFFGRTIRALFGKRTRE